MLMISQGIFVNVLGYKIIYYKLFVFYLLLQPEFQS